MSEVTPQKKPRERQNYAEEHKQRLMEEFDRNNYPARNVIEDLAFKLDRTVKQIKDFFYNRRVKKREAEKRAAEEKAAEAAGFTTAPSTAPTTTSPQTSRPGTVGGLPLGNGPFLPIHPAIVDELHVLSTLPRPILPALPLTNGPFLPFHPANVDQLHAPSTMPRAILPAPGSAFAALPSTNGPFLPIHPANIDRLQRDSTMPRPILPAPGHINVVVVQTAPTIAPGPYLPPQSAMPPPAFVPAPQKVRKVSKQKNLPELSKKRDVSKQKNLPVGAGPSLPTSSTVTALPPPHTPLPPAQLWHQQGQNADDSSPNAQIASKTSDKCECEMEMQTAALFYESMMTLIDADNEKPQFKPVVSPAEDFVVPTLPIPPPSMRGPFLSFLLED